MIIAGKTMQWNTTLSLPMKAMYVVEDRANTLSISLFPMRAAHSFVGDIAEDASNQT